MQTIYHLLTVGLLWLHFAAMAAYAGPRLDSWAIGRASAVMLLILAGFFVEHIVGLGSLSYLFPFSAGLSLYVLWQSREKLKANGFISAELIFGAALLYGLMWKEFFPNIYITSERLPDLVFITNYMGGEHLPPVDHWNPPYLFDYYYSLQYYAAALAGRLLHMSPGLAYNICFAVIQALSATLIWDVASRFIPRRSLRVLLLAVLLCGGTGASVFTHLIRDEIPDPTIPVRDYQWKLHNEYVTGSGHFIGEYDRLINNKLGHALFSSQKDPASFVPNVGMENLGFQFYQSDFHAPLGGYCLLLLALALIAALESNVAKVDKGEQKSMWSADALRHAAMALTIPAVFAINTWVFPFQVALIGAWVLRRAWQGRTMPALKPDWAMLSGGCALGFVLLYFFMIGFTQGREPTPIRWVVSMQHTPLPQFLALFWPMLVLIGIGLLRQETRRLTVFFSAVFAGLLLFSECFFVDDPWDGAVERYNSTMKWWGWIWTGSITALGALLLASPRKWVKISTAMTLSLTLVYAVDMVNAIRYLGEGSFGLLDGAHVYTREAPVREMFRYLTVAPDGILLENQYEIAYHDGGAYGAFTGKPVLLGWPGHLERWRGRSEARIGLHRQINDFYKGVLLNPGQWLISKKVRYIVWNPRDTQAEPVWEKINSEISSMYSWESFGDAGGRPVGLWVKAEH